MTQLSGDTQNKWIHNQPFKVSIILATYNWHTALEVVLSCLVPQIKAINHTGFNGMPVTVELLIADDGSTDETKQVILKYKKQLPNLKHIWHEDIGFRKTVILNNAVKVADGDYLIFLDGDCIPFPDYIVQHLKLSEVGYFIAGNRVLLAPKITQEIITQMQKINTIFAWKSFRWLQENLIHKSVNKMLPWVRLSANNKLRYLHKTKWQIPKGCNFALWRKDFMAVNGFDETFIGWGHEDSDLFIRLLHYGVLIKNGRFAIPVLHLWHKKFSRDLAPQNNKTLITRLRDSQFIKALIGINNSIHSTVSGTNKK